MESRTPISSSNKPSNNIVPDDREPLDITRTVGDQRAVDKQQRESHSVGDTTRVWRSKRDRKQPDRLNYKELGGRNNNLALRMVKKLRN